MCRRSALTQCRGRACSLQRAVRLRQKAFPKLLTARSPERMNTEASRVARVERVDDIPVLLATMRRLSLAEFLDRRYPTHHLWPGDLTPGEAVSVWLPFLPSECDH